MNNLPTARVDDILVHPRDNDLIVATMRGACGLPTTSPRCSRWRQSAPRTSCCSISGQRSLICTDRQRGQQTGGQKTFVGENPPRGTSINYYLKAASTGDVKITIADATGTNDSHARWH